MRVCALLLVAAVHTAAPPAAADCSDPFRTPEDVLTLTLRMRRADWDLVRLGEPVGQGCDAQYPFVTAELRCGVHEPFIKIGVRRKRGDQRGRDTDHKPAMKLDINRVVRGQRWPSALGELGFRKLSLNNGQADNPGGMQTVIASEHFAWRLLDREVALSPRVAYARVLLEIADEPSTPPEPHGLYILIEDIDRTALRLRFGADQGVLLKSTAGECRNEVAFDDGGQNAVTAAFEAWASQEPQGQSAPAGAWRAATEHVLGLEDLLRQEAIRDVLGNRHDTVLGNMSNHFAFDPAVEDGSARRQFLPWDVDDAFRPDVAPDEPLTPACSYLGDRTRCHPDIEPRYLEIVCQLLEGALAPEALMAEWEEIDALVRPLLAEEREIVWGGRDLLDAHTPRTYASEHERVLRFIEPRIAAVRQQLEDRGVFCPDACPVGVVERCTRLGCAGVRACVDGRFTPCEVYVDEACNGIDDDCDLIIDEGACPVRAHGDASATTGAAAAERKPTAGCSCSGARAMDAAAWAALALGLRRPSKCRRRG